MMLRSRHYNISVFRSIRPANMTRIQTTTHRNAKLDPNNWKLTPPNRKMVSMSIIQLYVKHSMEQAIVPTFAATSAVPPIVLT